MTKFYTVKEKTDYYLIENEVLFFPENATLRHIEKEEEITLFSTASRCLEFLIERHGSTLSQKELMDFGWLGQGHNVTQNTLYQNISNIRKAFSALLPERQIIVTIKRIGLVIPNEISVIASKNVVTEDNAILVAEETGSVIPKEIVSPTMITEPASLQHIGTTYSLFSKTFIGLFIFSVITLVSSIYLHYTKIQQKNVFPFRNYVIYKKFDNGCTVLINPDAGKVDPTNRYLNSLSDCKGYKEVYVTLWEQRIATSAMYCSPADNGEGYSCISEYFARSQK